MHSGFVFLDEIIPGLKQDARYAAQDNFTGARVDGYCAARVAGSLELARALKGAQDAARERGLELMVWDAYRPQRAVDAFLRWAAAPEDGRTKARYYPNIDRRDIVPMGYVAPRSAHSRGGAVDLTLVCAGTGAQLDMDGGFDLMDARSGHGAPGIRAEAARNRALLRRIMEQSGFCAYESEWWHYQLRDEPYPHIYFDFVIDTASD